MSSDADSLALPQPDEVTKRERDDAMGAYLMMFAACGAGLPLPILNMIAAVIYFFVNRGSSRFVAFHSLQSLLWQIPVTLVNLVAVVWLVRIIWWNQPATGRFWGCVILAALVNIVYIVVFLIALGRARRGRMFYIWVTGRVACARYFGPQGGSLARQEGRDAPPAGL